MFGIALLLKEVPKGFMTDGIDLLARISLGSANLVTYSVNRELPPYSRSSEADNTAVLWAGRDSGGGCHGTGNRAGSDEALPRVALVLAIREPPERDSEGELSNELAGIADSALRKEASLAVQRRRFQGTSNEGGWGTLNCSLADIYYSITFGGSYRYFNSFAFLS